MNAVVIPNSSWKDILTELIAAGNLWDGAKVHLFKNNVTPSPGMLIGDLTEADFDGYAASSAIVWGTPGFLPDGTAAVVGTQKTFTVGASPVVLNTVYGYYVTDGAGTGLLFARKFDAAVVLSAGGQFIVVLPTYPAYGSVV
jgi:hypothetical protein